MQSYPQGMVSRAKDTHTTNRVVRMGDEWEKLGAVVGDRKRAEHIRAMVSWWLREPGAKMPERLSREEIARLIAESEAAD